MQEFLKITKNIDDFKLKQLNTNAKLNNPEIIFQTIQQHSILIVQTKKADFNIDSFELKNYL